MDAHALLAAQGWRGTGHTLNPHSDSIGLSRPILVSNKQNKLGVGKKQHKTSDLWWMNAFDKSLKGLDTTEEGKVVQTVTNGGLDMVAKGGHKYVGGGGLYASFVRGEGLSGTLTPEEPAVSSSSVRDEATPPIKRHKTRESVPDKATPPVKRDKTRELDDDAERKRAERRARKASRRARAEPPETLKPEAGDKFKINKKKEKKRRNDS